MNRLLNSKKLYYNMTTFMIKKIERDMCGRTKIYHITTVKQKFNWAEFFDENGDYIREIAESKSGSQNGEFIVLPVSRVINTRSNVRFISGHFEKPIFKVFL